VRIVVPSLNTRREDIPLLLAHLVRGHAADRDSAARRFFSEGRPEGVPRVSPFLMEALVQHAYTTNVRELEAFLVSTALGSHGRYLELGPELRRDLSARPARSTKAKPATTEIPDLTPEESLRLSLLRKHRFSPTACGRDAAYPGNRQTADLHLRQLLCRALCVADWSVPRAADLLAGPAQPELRDRCAARVATFLTNLRGRIESDPADDLRRALAEEWKSGAESVLLVVEALREGRISGG
jgi:DNA-binding NtrC family response regulator